MKNFLMGRFRIWLIWKKENTKKTTQKYIEINVNLLYEIEVVVKENIRNIKNKKLVVIKIKIRSFLTLFDEYRYLFKEMNLKIGLDIRKIDVRYIINEESDKLIFGKKTLTKGMMTSGR